MICSISGEIAKEPVVSSKSGLVFEKKLIERYIQTTGKDPITDEKLELEALVPIKNQVSDIVPPKPPKFTSIPNLLSEFQNQWDSLVLEVFSLRKQLQKAKEELSHSLYQKDAAINVAARAIRERDEAKNALEELVLTVGKVGVENQSEATSNDKGIPNKSAGEDSSNDTYGALPVEIISKAREELFLLHKSQKPTLPIDPEQKIKMIEGETLTQPFKKISCTYIDSFSKMVYIGSSNGVVAYQRIEEDEVGPLNKVTHKGKITAIGEIALGDESLPLIAFSNKLFVGKEKLPYPNHQSVIKIDTHPSLQNYFILLSEHAWSFNSISESKMLFSSPLESSATCGAFHIDGALYGIGTRMGEVLIYDLTTSSLVTTIKSKFNDVRKIAFGPYWLFLLSFDDSDTSSLEIFDLRKNISIHVFNFSPCIQDFALDPSNTILVTYDFSNTLSISRYIKKGKSWSEKVCSTELKNPSKLQHIESLSTAEDDSFISDGVVTFVGICENSSVIRFNLERN